ncbi:MAG TPA: CDP-alcohol phosphatidyltransferase family protein [Azospirillaceae bacterium]|nr:CDP-alcohol phosphatidyltransferase family protein [Azospirillaceae bacterium]
MLDARLRRVVDPPLDRIGTILAARGVRPDYVTAAGFLVGTVAWVALAFQAYGAALGLILANRILDGLDGAVARRGAPTDAGGFLDIVCDFVFYSGVAFFFAVGRPEAALPAAFLVFSFVGTGSSFLAYAVFAAKRGLDTSIRGRKSLYYIGGLTEGTETIALFVLICLLPDWFAWFAWGFGALCWLTTGVRTAAGLSAFRAQPPPRNADQSP